MILDKSWDHPSNPLFKELNWLPLQSRINYNVALLVFKIHTNLAPNYLNTVLLFTSNSRYDWTCVVLYICMEKMLYLFTCLDGPTEDKI